MATAAVIPPTHKMKEKRLYVYKRGNLGDLECWASCLYQAIEIMRAFGFNVDPDKVLDMGPAKVTAVNPLL